MRRYDTRVICPVSSDPGYLAPIVSSVYDSAVRVSVRGALRLAPSDARGPAAQ
jgi:hypothetical protein